VSRHVMHQSAAQVIVIGGGIAGLAAAWSLLCSGKVRVTLIESEPSVFFKASGQNAAIFRPLEADRLLVDLATQSLELLEDLQRDASEPLLRHTGLLMLSHNSTELERMAANAGAVGLAVERWARSDLARRVAGLSPKGSTEGLHCPLAGVLDVHALGQTLLRKVTRAGGEVQLHQAAQRLLLSPSGQCIGVELGAGHRLHADAVVLCAGAASGRLSHELSAPLPLLPLQRHLAIVEGEHGLLPDAPVIWQTDPEIYFRRESGGVLVSPCDETPSPAATAQPQLSALFPLSERFLGVYPGLAGAQVRRFWACIRTKAPDNRPIIGPAPYVPGLFYLTGLGGFGMSCGLGAGARLAECVLHGRMDAALDPRRFYLPWSRASSSNMRSAGV